MTRVPRPTIACSTSPALRGRTRHYSDGQALDFAALSHRDSIYLDVHCTVWTPASFVEVMSRVIGMGLINAQLSEPIGRNPAPAGTSSSST